MQDFRLASETDPILSEWQLAGGWTLGKKRVSLPLDTRDSNGIENGWFGARSSIEVELQNSFKISGSISLIY